MKKVRFGIMGAGRMASVLMDTVNKMDIIEPYAVASRDLARAEEFAKTYGVEKAYGSYEEMLADPNVDLVYVVTPPSVHAQQMKMCIEAGKAVFCEKPFTLTAQEARDVLALAKEKNVFVGEAIWTRYMPMVESLEALKSEPLLGEIRAVYADLGYPVWHKPRVQDVKLGGGALFDVGIYPLTFVDIMVGTDYAKLQTLTNKVGGVDQVGTISMLYPDGKMVSMLNGTTGPSDRQGIIYGSEGYAIVENVNNFEQIRIYDKMHVCVKTIDRPEQISGYEYELESAAKALEAGAIECPEMPHDKIIAVMEVMEAIWKSIDAE